MHTETDVMTKWRTLSNITGKPIRYYVLRAWVRGLWPVAVLSAAWAWALSALGA